MPTNGCGSSEAASVNTSQLKNYAPEARKDFIAAVSAQAAGSGSRPRASRPRR